MLLETINPYGIPSEDQIDVVLGKVKPVCRPCKLAEAPPKSST